MSPAPVPLSLTLSTGEDPDIGRRADLLSIASGAIEAARPGPALQRILEDDTDHFWDECRQQGYALLAVGKAAEQMAGATALALGPPRDGLIVTHASVLPLNGVETIIGGHPVPSRASLTAGERLVQLVGNLPPDMPLVVLISGGASALCEVPKPGISLDDLTDLNQSLLKSGLAIDQVNTVRQATSSIKGGGLARLIGSRPHRGLLISDVVGDDLSSIGSGLLTAPDWRKGHPWEIMSQADAPVPEALVQYLRSAEPQTASSPYIQIVANGALVAERARELGTELGLRPEVMSTTLQGDVEQAVRSCLENSKATLSIWTGETTVRVTGGGLGGRNQHAALLAAFELAKGSKFGDVLMVGTDGRDGPTDAAGAVVDSLSIARMRDAGVDPQDSLARHDSHGGLEAAGDLITAHPTGTNVGDLWLFCRHESPSP